MKRYLLSTIICFGSTVLSLAAPHDPQKGGLTLIRDGATEYRIVIAENASDADKSAAEELQIDLRRVSGGWLPITTDRSFPSDKEILIGDSKRLKDLGIDVPFKKLGAEGFTIRTIGKRLLIVGGPEKGAIYGISTFLEDYVGYRWYSEDVSFYPMKLTLTIPKINVTQIPKVIYRDIYYGEARNRAFMDHQKINGLNYDAKHGGDTAYTIRGSLNGWCHTMFTYVSPDEYFKTHPEYFALRDGKRTPTQLCLTNPDVLKIVVEKLRKLYKENPKFLYSNVSQMDNGDPCTCDKCKAIDDREGSYSGTTLDFVNKVAAFFPNKRISTLAYWYTMGPPKTIKPAKNVLVIYCTDTDRRPPFYDWYKGWVKIAPHRYHWYYVIPCHNSVAPWPNFFFMKKDIKEFVDGGMTGSFVEGSNETGSEFADLRIYVLAKLLWNPNCDVDAVIDDFVKGFYGDAAPFIHSYIYEMNDSMMKAGDQLNGHDWCQTHAKTFLSSTMLARYETLFDQAEKAVASQPDFLLRVHKARIPLMHAELQLGYGDVDYRLALLARMGELATETNLKFFADFGQRPTEAYLAEVLADLQREKQAKK